MPKKIENPLREGLISKVYLTAFPEYKTAYQIAVKELDVRSSQVTREINREKYSDLFDRKEVGEKKKPIRSEVEPFIEEMEDKGLTLKVPEWECLRNYLNGPFRKAVDAEYLGVDMASKSLDAYEVILGQLKLALSPEYAIRVAFDKTGLSAEGKQDIKDIKESAYDEVRKFGKGSGENPLPWKKDIVASLDSFSLELLEKVIFKTKQNSPVSNYTDLTNSLLLQLIERGGIKGSDLLSEFRSKQ